jgi:hypothetical protein
MRSDCCARTATGHAAVLPSPAMNVRRRIRDLPRWSGRSLSRWWFQGNGVAVQGPRGLVYASRWRSLAVLRRALKPITSEENEARLRELGKQECALWLREYPGMTAKDYRRLLDTEVREWRGTKNAARIAAERQDWQREHPGEVYPEHECGLSGRAYTDLECWRRQRRRKRVTGARATA